MSNRANKLRMKEIIGKFEREKAMRDFPEYCYCDEPDYDADNSIGQTDPVDGFPHPESKNYTEPIYLCKTCGKKYVLHFAY